MTKATVIYWVLGLAVLIILGAGGYWFVQNGNLGASSLAQQETKDDYGRVVISITDGGVDVKSLNSLEMTVSQIKLHSASEGWMTISANSQTFDLLELKNSGKLVLAASAKVAEGIYDKIRVRIDNVVVTEKGKERVKASLPSSEVLIDNDIHVSKNATTNATLDFIADSSVHTTSKGEFIFAPVIEIETRSNAVIEEKIDGTVEVRGGIVLSDIQVGMNLEGEMNHNYIIDTNSNLEIINGVIKIKGSSDNMINIDANGSLKIDY